MATIHAQNMFLFVCSRKSWQGKKGKIKASVLLCMKAESSVSAEQIMKALWELLLHDDKNDG